MAGRRRRSASRGRPPRGGRRVRHREHIATAPTVDVVASGDRIGLPRLRPGVEGDRHGVAAGRVVDRSGDPLAREQGVGVHHQPVRHRARGGVPPTDPGLPGSGRGRPGGRRRGDAAAAVRRRVLGLRDHRHRVGAGSVRRVHPRQPSGGLATADRWHLHRGGDRGSCLRRWCSRSRPARPGRRVLRSRGAHQPMAARDLPEGGRGTARRGSRRRDGRPGGARIHPRLRPPRRRRGGRPGAPRVPGACARRGRTRRRVAVGRLVALRASDQVLRRRPGAVGGGHRHGRRPRCLRGDAGARLHVVTAPRGLHRRARPAHRGHRIQHPGGDRAHRGDPGAPRHDAAAGGPTGGHDVLRRQGAGARRARRLLHVGGGSGQVLPRDRRRRHQRVPAGADRVGSAGGPAAALRRSRVPGLQRRQVRERAVAPDE